MKPASLTPEQQRRVAEIRAEIARLETALTAAVRRIVACIAADRKRHARQRRRFA